MAKSGGKMYRSAVSGQFVTKAHTKRSPSTTVTETRGGGSTGSHRSAITGKFVKPSAAKRHPGTTTKES